MENNLQTFMNAKFGTVRSIVIDGEPYLVGKDIALLLGYENYNRDIIRHIDEDDRILVNKTQYQNGIEFDYKELGQRGGWLINESGFYALVFGSEIKSAKKFKKWVTTDVLPTIRKHGLYATDSTIETMLNNPDTMIRVLQELKSERKQKIILQEENKRLLPDAQMANDIIKYEGLYTLKEIADVIECGRTELCTLLRLGKVLSKQSGYNLPLRQYIKLGYFKVKIHNNLKIPVTLITPKGLRFIYRLIKKFHMENDFNTELLVSTLEDVEVA